MPIDIFLTVIVTTIIQSLFGVGVLLFGTPILLLLDYDFFNALSVLLPISIAINTLQIIKHHPFIDTSFYKKVVLFCIPFVVLFLFLISKINFNINLLVGGFLILVAAKNFFPSIQDNLEKMFRFEKTYLGCMGVIHGLTNLGGSLLTAIVHAKNLEKNTTRVTIAICYATFAFFQLATLVVIDNPFQLSFSDNMSLLQIGVIVFLLTEEILYTTINNQKYNQLFTLFLFISGLLLILK